MKFFVLGFILVGILILAAHADPKPEPAPEPEPAKGQRSSHPKFRAAPSDDVVELRAADDIVNDEKDDTQSESNQADASSGRLFMKKFLLFKNIFGSNQQQPVIPIIIAGNTGTGGTYITPSTTPTVTYTSTGSIPTASGTVTVTTPSRGFAFGSRYNDDAGEAVEDSAVMDDQAVQAALAAGAHEYVVTDEEIKGSSDSKATKQPGRINLRRRGAKKGQVISVRIPPKYRNYFKNGQKVMLNTSNRPVKRRVTKKRGGQNVRRRKVNKNRRNRIGAH